MAESTSVALAAATIPTSAEISRAEKLVRERFIHDGRGSRRRARPGHAAPARARRGPRRARAGPEGQAPLDRLAARVLAAARAWSALLSEEEPKLVDGTVLSAHQVDALSGTLTALLAEAQRERADGNGRSAGRLARAARLGRHPRPRRRTPTAAARADAEAPRRSSEDEEEDEDATRTTRRTTRTTRIRSRPARRTGRGRGRRGRGRGRASRPTTPRTTRPSCDRAEADEEPRDWVEDEEPTRSSSPSSPRTPTPPSASGSSTPPAPARRSPRSASSRPRRPAAC